MIAGVWTVAAAFRDETIEVVCEDRVAAEEMSVELLDAGALTIHAYPDDLEGGEER